MVEYIPIEKFLEMSRNFPMTDARSPAEFEHASIPGSINIPLLDNEQRKEVGIRYKAAGNRAAVKLGYRLCAPAFEEKIILAEKLVKKGNTILVYCWRGGLRSRILSFLFSSAGFNVYVLSGGYKSFRNYILNSFNEERKICILGGKTGSGKTKLLEALSQLGEQVINLEKLASHKGSAFGALGMNAQPSNEQFENLLAMELMATDRNKWLWLENESRSIGSVIIPGQLYNLMREALTIEICLPTANRVRNIINEYGSFSVEELTIATGKIKKRLGDLRFRQAVEYLQQQNLEAWVLILLEYYDKTYQFGMQNRKPDTLFQVYDESEDAVKTARLLIDTLCKNELCTSR